MTNSRPARTAPPHRRVPACGKETRLPAHLVPLALSFAGPDRARPEDVEIDLRCVLQAHIGGEHHAFVLQLDGTEGAAVWTTWSDAPPTQVEARADCHAVSPPEHGSEPCCEFAGHPGAHSFDVYDQLALPAAPGVFR